MENDNLPSARKVDGYHWDTVEAGYLGASGKPIPVSEEMQTFLMGPEYWDFDRRFYFICPSCGKKTHVKMDATVGRCSDCGTMYRLD